MNIDPSTTKYMIKARLTANGIVEKPDVVGAIFGQTEGLLGDELDLRDLQKSGRIGRIEVEVGSKRGKSEGEVMIPSSLDQVETVILAAALETIDRVGPCKADIEIESIEDVRISKRSQIIGRAREMLSELIKQSKSTGIDLTDSVRKSVQMEEIIFFGKEKMPAGPNVPDSDAIIVVEGRSDVLNLLKSGIKNAIAVQGTNVPKTITDLSKERIITAFVDGDRGGELILRELFQVAEVDFVARAPKGQEVEELTQKQIMKALRNKIPGEQFIEMYGLDIEIPKRDEDEYFPERPKKKEAPEKKVRKEKPKKEEKKTTPEQDRFRSIINELSSSSKARLMDSKGKVIDEIAVRDLVKTLKENPKEVESIVFDGIITQRILDIASSQDIKVIVGTRMGNVTKQPSQIDVWTRSDLN